MSACPTCGQTMPTPWIRPLYRMQKLSNSFGWQLNGNSDRFLFRFEHDSDGFHDKWSITANDMQDGHVLKGYYVIGDLFATRREAVQFALQWEATQPTRN